MQWYHGENATPDKCLSSADLTSAKFDYETDFTGVIFTDALFFNAQMSNAQLTNAILIGVDFAWADLTGADLSKFWTILHVF